MKSKPKTLSLLALVLMVLSPFPPAANAENEQTLVQDNIAFALDLYQELRTNGDNLFFSPYSISTALAMTYAGARGETETQMQKALHFSLPQDELHPAFPALQGKFQEIQEQGNVQLFVANSLWPHEEYAFKEEFLTLLQQYYDAEITALDYAQQPEQARQTINAWVEDNTNDKIQELIKPGVLDAMTRLVLANAIYFKGDWVHQFNEKATRDMPFKLSADQTVDTPMMYQEAHFGYWADEHLQVLELPYEGEQLSMLVLLPTQVDGLAQLEQQLNVENLKQWTDQLNPQEVQVWLPKFKLTSDFRLDQALQAMGMIDAFTRNADFSGMDGTRKLYISAAIHKAYVDVNEEGTEAAAATGISARLASARITPQFRADHPFMFLIRENQTGSILFMGRMTDPTQTGE